MEHLADIIERTEEEEEKYIEIVKVQPMTRRDKMICNFQDLYSKGENNG